MKYRVSMGDDMKPESVQRKASMSASDEKNAQEGEF